MRRARRIGTFCLTFGAAGLLAASGAYASEWNLFEHGGRATGQAGAFTARGVDPTTLTYDPAAITQLPGLQLEVGLDFDLPKDNYHSSTGTFSAKHDIVFPPLLYVTWKPQNGPFAFGLGVDSPMWSLENWNPAFNFPGRFITRSFSLQLLEAHPVVAYDLGDGYSVGAGLRYDYGYLQQGEEVDDTVTPGTGPQEISRSANAWVSGVGWDLSVHYGSPVWGWGAVYRSQSKLTGTGTALYKFHDAEFNEGNGTAFPNGRDSQAWELVPEERAGIWVAPYPELRLELDVSHQQWSNEPDTVVSYSPNPAPFADPQVRVRNWKDTNSIRLGAEGNVTDAWMIYGGAAYEESPVANGNVEPGFPRANAYVAAFGLSYNLPNISFDAGGSYYFYQDRTTTGQEPLNPAIAGTYASNDRVWAGSIRWRF